MSILQIECDNKAKQILELSEMNDDLMNKLQTTQNELEKKNIEIDILKQKTNMCTR